MTEDDKKPARIVHALWAFSSDAKVTVEEARAELEADGVDVDAAAAAALELVRTKKKDIRAALRERAISQVQQGMRSGTKRDRSGASLIDLKKEATARQVAPSFQKFESMTEADLRSLLEDADEVEDE